jgi:hypothetical protein
MFGRQRFSQDKVAYDIPGPIPRWRNPLTVSLTHTRAPPSPNSFLCCAASLTWLRRCGASWRGLPPPGGRWGSGPSRRRWTTSPSPSAPRRKPTSRPAGRCRRGPGMAFSLSVVAVVVLVVVVVVVVVVVFVGHLLFCDAKYLRASKKNS